MTTLMMANTAGRAVCIASLISLGKACWTVAHSL